VVKILTKNDKDDKNEGDLIFVGKRRKKVGKKKNTYFLTKINNTKRDINRAININDNEITMKCGHSTYNISQIMIWGSRGQL